MPSIINSDDGVVSGTSGLKTTGGNDGILALQNNGTTNVTVTAAGNVGIGTSSPGAKLELGSGTLLLSNNVFIQQKDSSGNAKNVAGLNSSNQYNIGGLDGSSTVDTVRILTGGTVRATVTSGGDFQFNSGYGSVATAYGCRAWVNFNGQGTVAIRASGNVSSITDNGTGDYTINMTTSMPDTNYACLVTGGGGNSLGRVVGIAPKEGVSPTTSAIRIYFDNPGIPGAVDIGQANAAIFR